MELWTILNLNVDTNVDYDVEVELSCFCKILKRISNRWRWKSKNVDEDLKMLNLKMMLIKSVDATKGSNKDLKNVGCWWISENAPWRLGVVLYRVMHDGL
jgi:hypothetical protein